MERDLTKNLLVKLFLQVFTTLLFITVPNKGRLETRKFMRELPHRFRDKNE